MATVRVNKTTPASIPIRVELFGRPRMLVGRRELEIIVSAKTCSSDMAMALGKICPELVGNAILEDLSGLQESYTFNLNGMSFVGDEQLHLKPNDTLLLFSSQAGG